MDCVCLVSDYDPCTLWQEKWLTTRKQHVCCECGEVIEKGERAHRIESLYDDCWSRDYTCEPCARMREQMCCRGFVIGELRERVFDALGIDYVTGEIDEWANDDEVSA